MIDDILTTGAAGVEFFDVFLGRANAAGAALETTVDLLANRYYEQRGIDTDSISAAGDGLRAAADDLAARATDQRSSRSLLAGCWSGSAADAAISMMDVHSAQAESDIASLRSAGDALGAAAAAIVSVVTDKARTAADAHALEVDGHSAEQVDAVLAAADRGPDPTADAESAECRSWLNDVFVPAVRDRVSAFLDMCTATDDAVRDILTAAATAFEPFSVSEYPDPTAVGHCACPPVSSPDRATPNGRSEAFDSGVEPAVTDWAAAAPTVSGPSSVAPDLTRAVADAVRDVVAAELRGMADGPASVGTAPPELPVYPAETSLQATDVTRSPEVGHIEAELGGHGVRLALSVDGTIGVEVTDSAACTPDNQALEGPAPDSPTSDVPATETPAPETPDPETPAPETLTPETPAPNAVDPETPDAEPSIPDPAPLPAAVESTDPAAPQAPSTGGAARCVPAPSSDTAEPELASTQAPVPEEPGAGAASPGLAEAGGL